METTQQQDQVDNQIEFTPSIMKDFEITSKWAYFISISTFILFGLTLVGYLFLLYKSFEFSTVSFSDYLKFLPKEVYFLMFGVAGILVVLILSSFALLNFSTEMTRAISLKDTYSLNESLDHLFKFFKLTGICILGGFGFGLIIYIYLYHNPFH